MTELPEEHDSDKRLWQRVRPGGRQAKRSPCPDPQEMAAYLEEKMSAAQREGVEGHVAHCTACLDALVELRGLLGLPPMEPAIDVRRLAKALVVGSPLESHVVARWVPEFMLRRAIAWGVSAALLVGAGLLGHQLGQGTVRSRNFVASTVAAELSLWSVGPASVEPSFRLPF